MSLLNKNWIMVHRAPVSTNQSLLLSQGHFANSSIHPTPLTTMKQPCRQSSLIGPQLQSSGSISSAACRIPDSRSKDGIWTSICDLPKANDAPVTLKEYIAASKLASKPQFKRPSLQVDTSVHEDDKSRITPNNTPQTATNQSKAISVVEGVSISSVYLDVADLNPDIGKSEDSRQPENESFNGIHTDEIQA
jgi:hypothetical protein